MPNARIYRGTWLMMDDTTSVQVDIHDKSVYVFPGDDPEIIPFQTGGNPLVVSVIDNDRKKLTPIRAKQAKIEIMTENGIDITTFSSGPDNRFYVEITTGANCIFKGFLIAADLSQTFLPHQQTLVLTAADGLGLLRDVPLTDFDGDNPVGKNKIIKYIAWALSKTGNDTSFIKAANNIRHGSGKLTNQALFSVAGQYIVTSGLHTDFFYVGQEITVTNSVSNNGTYRVTAVDNSGVVTTVYIDTTITTGEHTLGVVFTDTSSAHFYETCYLDAKTFEKEIGESIDCREVLEIILGNDCFLTQYLGDWYIMRIDEYDENLFDFATFENDGTFDSFNEDYDLSKSIGSTEDLRFVNADCSVERERALGFAKLSYNYNSPLENPCNIDFSRGDLTATISATEKRYELDCWTLRAGFPGGYISAGGTTVYLKRIFNDLSYETERYIALTPRTVHESGSAEPTYIESEGIPVHEKDKFSASIQFRLPTNISTGGGNFRLFRFILAGDDGSYWILGRPSDTSGSDDTQTWYDTAGWTLNTGRGKTTIDFDTVTETDWQTISWDAPPIPVDGTLYIWINQFNQLAGSDDDKDIYYSDLQFGYIPYINGSYQKYSGQYQKVTRTEPGYLNKVDEEVFMSDSPKKIFKGAMFLLINGAYVLTNRFYTFNVFGENYPGDGYCHPYGETQIRSVYNQGIYENWVFTGNVLGLTEMFPDIVHKYSLTDAHPATSDKYFVMVSMEQDWKFGIMNCVFVEVYDRVSMKSYSEEREFKYITNG